MPRHITKNLLEMKGPEGLEGVPRIGELQGIIADLPARQKHTVLNETVAFYEARRQAGASYLAMGQHLLSIRDVLEPLEKWRLYCNLLPNITQATAYRMIWAYENATRTLPPATRNVAITDGYKLISSKKDETFAPGYDAAVATVTKELGPAPAEDENEARTWLQAVMQAKRKLRKGRSAVTEVTIESQEAKIVAAVEKVIKGLDANATVNFGQRVAGMIITLCRVPAYKAKPVSVPEHYLHHRTSNAA